MYYAYQQKRFFENVEPGRSACMFAGCGNGNGYIVRAYRQAVVKAV